MGKVNYSGLIKALTKVFSKKTIYMERVFTNGKMEDNSKEHILTILWRVTESSHGRTVENT